MITRVISATTPTDTSAKCAVCGKTDISLYFSAIPREERLKIRYVTIDMLQPYKDVAKTYLPNTIV
ncbi:MAG TPA: transposase [Candidatus Avanaerovorax faecigallinarum]|nr:transposase [Candidatus Avanaerovorax faecigallinarum]